MSDPKIINIPIAYNLGKQISYTPNDGSGDLDYTRAGSGSIRTKSAGLEVLAENMPRLNWPVSFCPNWIYEPQRTNLLDNSDLNDYTPANATRGLAQVESGINGFYYDGSTSPSLERSLFTIQSSSTLSFSVFVDTTKSTEYEILMSVNSISTNYVKAVFSSASKSIVVSRSGTYLPTFFYWNDINCKAEQFDGDIWKLTVTGRDSFGLSSLITKISFDSDTTGVWLGGGQLEYGHGSTSLIPTSGSQLTRGSDYSILTGLNQTEGAVYLKFNSNNIISDNLNDFIILGGGSTNNGSVYMKGASIKSRGTIYVRNENNLNSAAILQDENKIVVNYSIDGVDVWINGDKKINFITPFTLFANQIIFNGVAHPFNIGLTAVYDARLTDQQCDDLTSPPEAPDPG